MKYLSVFILLISLFGCEISEEQLQWDRRKRESDRKWEIERIKEKQESEAFKDARTRHLADTNLDPRIKSCIEERAICIGMTLQEVKFAMTDCNPDFGKFIVENSYGDLTYEFVIGNFKAAWVNFEEGKVVSWTIHQDRYHYPP